MTKPKPKPKPKSKRRKPRPAFRPAPVGRPSKLTPEVQAAIVMAIRCTKLSLADCGRSLGLPVTAISDWLHRGRAETSGIFHGFAVAVTQARADGTKMLLARIAKAGQEPKHWQANVALLSMTEPSYAPRVRAVVVEELTDAVKRLEEEFRNEPELLDRATAALAGEHRSATALAPQDGEDDGAVAASGEAVLTAPTAPEAEGIPRA